MGGSAGLSEKIVQAVENPPLKDDLPGKPGLGKKLRIRKYVSMKFWVPYMFVFPALALLLIFVLIPLILTFALSFTDWNLMTKEFNWVGLQQYEKLIHDPLFWQVALNTVTYTVFSVFLSLVISLPLASMFDQGIRGSKLYKSLVFIPYITPMVPLSIVFLWIFDQHYGVLNSFLAGLGIQDIPWLTQPGWAMFSIILINVWKTIGYNTLIILAGLQNISNSVIEAARMDGANNRQIYMKMTLPLLSPSIFFVIVIGIISSFQAYDIVYMMTQGGPVNSTNMIMYYLYQHGFQFFDTAYGSAVAVILFIVLITLTIIQMTWSKKWVHYS